MSKPLTSLAAIALCAMLLLLTAGGLEEIGEKNARREWEQTIHTLLPGSEQFTREPETWEDESILQIDKGDTGYVLTTRTRGYAGPITLAVGVSKGGTVTGLQVRSLSETRGLGAEALHNGDFLAQFLNTSGSDQVDALAGATVTSKAIARGVNAAVAWVTGGDVSSGATAWGN